MTTNNFGGMDRRQKAKLIEELEAAIQEKERRAFRKAGVPKFTKFFEEHITRYASPSDKDGVKELTPAQSVMCKIAFDGDDRSDLSNEERVLADKIFGFSRENNYNGKITEHARKLFIEVAGARAGKTYLCALRLLHLALTVDMGSLASGEEGLAIVVAPNLKQAEQTLNYISGVINRSPALQTLVVGKMLKTRINLRRQNGQVVSIQPRAAAKGGLTGRGFSVIAAFMDETAFFRGSDYAVNDGEIFSSMYQRILPTSQMLIASTPWAREGLLWSQYEENFGHPVNGLCAHAPTLLMNPSERNIATYEMVKKGDPERARREYDAEFLSAAAEAFFDPVTIERSIDEELTGGIVEPVEGSEIKAGADFGFERDSSALVIIHSYNGAHRVADVVHRTPEGETALRPSEVVEDFAEHCKHHQAGWVMSDIHYRQSIIEHLNEYNLNFIEAPKDTSIPYVATRIMLHQGLIRLPKDPKLINQLKSIKAKKTSGGKIQIIKPRQQGFHCDIADAFVLAAFQAAGSTIPLSEPDPSTPEGQRYINDKLKEVRRDTQIREYDRRLNGNHLKTSPDERIRPRFSGRNKFQRGW